MYIYNSHHVLEAEFLVVWLMAFLKSYFKELKMTDENQNIKTLIPIKNGWEMMGIKKTAFYNEVHKGNIVLKKYGRKSLCTLESVQQWINAPFKSWVISRSALPQATA